MITNKDEGAPVVALHPILDQAPDAGVHLLANHGCADEMEPEATSDEGTLAQQQGKQGQVGSC